MKNTIKNLLIVIVFSLLLFSCSDNSTNPVENILSNQIFGHWNNNNYSITFLDNRTFIDTLYFEGIKDTSYPNYGMFVRKGNYNIQNNILSLTDFYFDEVHTKASIGFQLVYISYELKIVNDILTMRGVNIFEAENSNGTELNGSWKLNGYYCVYSQDNEPVLSSGQTTETYNFLSDSLKYIYTENYLSGVYASSDPYSYQGDYMYNKPYLDLPIPSYYHLLVKFIGNKMYWYNDFEDTFIKN